MWGIIQPAMIDHKAGTGTRTVANTSNFGICQPGGETSDNNQGDTLAEKCRRKIRPGQGQGKRVQESRHNEAHRQNSGRSGSDDETNEGGPHPDRRGRL
jgi:hypothetical protein